MSKTATKRKTEAAPAQDQPAATERFPLVGGRIFRDTHHLELRADGVWCFREFSFSSDKSYVHANRENFLKEAALPGDGWEVAKTPTLSRLYDYAADKLHPELEGRIEKDWHWGGEDPASSSVFAWGVSLYDGLVYWYGRSRYGRVFASRLVPAGQF